MEGIVPFNRYEVTDSDLEFLQTAKDDEIKSRLTDRMSNSGIVIPRSASYNYIQNRGIRDVANFPTDPVTQFIINGTIGANNFSIGEGLAYDKNGERIVILSSDTTIYNGAMSSPTNFITAGSVTISNTPYSTGAISIPILPTEATNYVFVRYLRAIKTGAYPADHQTAIPATSITLASGDPAKKQPITSIDAETGAVYAPLFMNGYEVLVVGGTSVTPGSNPPTIIGKEDAIYIGKLTVDTGLGQITGVDQNDPTTLRPVLELRSQEVVTIDTTASTHVPTVTPPGTQDPMTYDGVAPVDLFLHASALGTASLITPTNPHRLSVNDIEGGGEEPKNEEYQRYAMADGITDRSVARNNPIPAAATLGATATLTNPFGTPEIINASIPSGVPAGTTAVVAMKQPISGASNLFINGIRMTACLPVFPTDNRTFVAFGTSGPVAAGPYDIIAYVPSADGIHASSYTAQMIYLASGTAPTGIPTNAGYMIVATVYWDTIKLKTSVFGPTLATTGPTEDKRSFGLVSTPQISTQAMGDPVLGMLTNFKPSVNHLSDGDFSYNVLNTISDAVVPSNQFSFWVLAKTNAIAPTTATSISEVTLPSIATAGPKTARGIRLLLTSSGTALNVTLRGKMRSIKPATTYVLSAWVYCSAPVSGKPNVNMSVKFVNSSGLVDRSTPKDVIFTRDGTWRKISVPITTLDIGTTIFESPEVVFSFDSSAGTGDWTLYMTNIMVTEGEWVGEFVKTPMTYYRQTNTSFTTSGMIPLTWYDLDSVTFYSSGQLVVANFAGWCVGLYGAGASNGSCSVSAMTVDGAVIPTVSNIYSTTYLSSGAGDSYLGKLAGPSISWSGWLAPGVHTIKSRAWQNNQTSNGGWGCQSGGLTVTLL